MGGKGWVAGGLGVGGATEMTHKLPCQERYGVAGKRGGGSTHMTHEVPCDVCVCVWWRGGGLHLQQASMTLPRW